MLIRFNKICIGSVVFFETLNKYIKQYIYFYIYLFHVYIYPPDLQESVVTTIQHIGKQLHQPASKDAKIYGINFSFRNMTEI